MDGGVSTTTLICHSLMNESSIEPIGKFSLERAIIWPLFSFSLNFLDPPEIIEPPRDVSVRNGGIAAFYCRAHGEPTPQLSWRRNGRKVTLGLALDLLLLCWWKGVMNSGLWSLKALAVDAFFYKAIQSNVIHLLNGQVSVNPNVVQLKFAVYKNPVTT